MSYQFRTVVKLEDVIVVANQMAKFNYWKESSFKVITEQVADGESRKECVVTARIPGNSKFEGDYSVMLT